MALIGAVVAVLATPLGSLETNAAGTVSGRVYQDFLSNGVFNTAVAAGQAADIGVGGITVNAFDSTGARVGATTSSSDGSYVLSVTGITGTDLRIEFSIPSTSPLSSLQSSFSGADNGTSIQFVSVGATNVDYGVNVPSEYCQNNPLLCISRLVAGENGVSGAASAWITQYNGGPFTTAHGWTNVYNNWSSTMIANQSETGSILGMAWDQSTRRVYHSAYIRRHALMYEIADRPVPGAIFVSTPSGTETTPATGGTTSFLVDLETLLSGDQFSNSSSGGPGFIPTNAARKLRFFNDGVADGGAENDGVDSDLVSGQDGVFEEVGRAGIGDIATDGNGNLFVVSMYNKNLYRVTLPTSGAPTTMVSLGDITSGIACTNGSGRPFSVKFWRGSLYLGVVCDGEQDFDPASPLVVANANLSFTIRKYDLATLAWSTFFGPHSLNTAGRIQKGLPDTGFSRPTFKAWNPWTTTYANSYPANGTYMAGSNYDLHDYSTRPQPMLSEIEFDRDGSMILAFRDRNADIMGAWQSEAPDGSSSPYVAFASGDVYRVCRTGNGYSASDYTFEGVLGCQSTPTRPYPSTLSLLSDDEYRVNHGVEYYWGDFWWHTERRGHGENTVGLTALAPGFPDLFVTAFDPMDGDDSYKSFYAGGIRSFSNSTGGPSGSPNLGSGVIFYAGGWDGGTGNPNPNTLGGFGKVNGMSDIEVLCNSAPLQIGNRVWFDSDRDGIQDAGESSVAGVTVRLYASDGTTLLGTAVTDANGTYYFASDVNEVAAGTGDNVGGGISPGSAYIIRLDNPTDFTGSGLLAGYSLTSTMATDAVTSLDTSVDSNGSMVASYPQLVTAVLQAGVNNHTYDVGFYNPAVAPPTTVAPSAGIIESSPPTSTVRTVMTLTQIAVGMGNYTWIDANKNGVQDPNESPLAGVKVTLRNPDGTVARDLSNGLALATTDTNGYYFIDNLAAGSYFAEFEPPVGYTFTARASTGSTIENDSNPDTQTGKTPVFVIGTSRSSETSVDIDPKTKAVWANPTIDAGFIPIASVSVGNFVWRDRNGDGLQGRDDVGVPGVKLEISTARKLPVVDVFGRLVGPLFTDKNGFYLFRGLPPGQYVVNISYPKGFIPTTRDRRDRGRNSSSNRAVSEVLLSGTRDMTLDFGVVRVNSLPVAR